VLEVTKDYPYSCLVNIQIIGNEFATKRYKRFLELNLDWFQAAATTYAIAAHPNINDLRVLLRGNKPQINKFFFKDSRTPLLFTIIVQSRLMGEDTGHDTLLDIGKQIKNISNDQQRVFRKLSPFELEQVKKIQEEFI
jgi:hypothetical protein